MAKQIWKASWIFLAAAHAFFAVKLLANGGFLELSVLARLVALLFTIGFCAAEALQVGPISWLCSQRDWRTLAISGIVIAMLHGAVPSRYLEGEGAMRIPPEATLVVAVLPVMLAAGLGALAEWLRRLLTGGTPELVPVRIKRRVRFSQSDYRDIEGFIRQRLAMIRSGSMTPQPPPSKSSH